MGARKELPGNLPDMAILFSPPFSSESDPSYTTLNTQRTVANTTSTADPLSRLDGMERGGQSGRILGPDFHKWDAYTDPDRDTVSVTNLP